MSAWFNFNLQNNGCGCGCNSGFNFGGFGGGFNMPGGIFSYTTFGMINGDYSFYNPVPSMDMYTYFPGMSLFNTPCGGFQFNNDIFGSLLNATAMQLNQQSFWNSVNGGFPGINNNGFNFNFNGINGGGNGNGNKPMSEEEKEAKKEYESMKDFLDKYAAYLEDDDLKEDLKEITNLKITEHDEEHDRDKTRNATFKEKLAELKKVYNSITEADRKEFVISEESGLVVRGTRKGDKSNPDSVTSQLSEIGYERKTEIDSANRMQDLKDVFESSNDGKYTNNEILAALTSNPESCKILDVISSYNTNNNSSFIDDFCRAYSNATEEPLKTTVKTYLEQAKSHLVDKASSLVKKLGSNKDDFETLVNGLSSTSIDSSSFASKYKELYALTRVVAARILINELEEKYKYFPAGTFDFILADTEADLRKEGYSNETISLGEAYELKERKTYTSTRRQAREEAEVEEEEVEEEEETATRTHAASTRRQARETTPANATAELNDLTDGDDAILYVETNGTTRNGKKIYKTNIPIYNDSNCCASCNKGWFYVGDDGRIYEIVDNNPDHDEEITIAQIKSKVRQAKTSQRASSEETTQQARHNVNYAQAKKDGEYAAEKVQDRLQGWGTSDNEYHEVEAMLGMNTSTKDRDQKQLVNKDNVLFFWQKFKEIDQDMFFGQMQSECHHGRQNYSRQVLKYIIDNVNTLIADEQDTEIKNILGLYKEVLEEHNSNLTYRYYNNTHINNREYYYKSQKYYISNSNMDWTVSGLIDFLKKVKRGGF